VKHVLQCSKMVDSGTKPSVIASHLLNTVKTSQERKGQPQRQESSEEEEEEVLEERPRSQGKKSTTKTQAREQ
jgi:hypothetical protein